MPDELTTLYLAETPQANFLRNNFRRLNAAFSFASFVARERQEGGERGPPGYTVAGTPYTVIGPVQAGTNSTSARLSSMQIYFLDTSDAREDGRMQFLDRYSGTDSAVARQVVAIIERVMQGNNLAHEFMTLRQQAEETEMAYDRACAEAAAADEPPPPRPTIRSHHFVLLEGSGTTRDAAPTEEQGDDLYGLLREGSAATTGGPHLISVRQRAPSQPGPDGGQQQGLRYVSALHPTHDKLVFPLFYPGGDAAGSGWRPGLPNDQQVPESARGLPVLPCRATGLRRAGPRPAEPRSTTTTATYMEYTRTFVFAREDPRAPARIRAGQLPPPSEYIDYIHRSKRGLKMYLIVGWFALEGQRLDFLRRNQEQIRQGRCDVLEAIADTDAAADEADHPHQQQSTILPPSFTRGPRYGKEGVEAMLWQIYHFLSHLSIPISATWPNSGRISWQWRPAWALGQSSSR